jgi:hypothetical protein
MSEISFETALGARVEDMVDACTRCGTGTITVDTAPNEFTEFVITLPRGQARESR